MSVLLTGEPNDILYESSIDDVHKIRKSRESKNSITVYKLLILGMTTISGTLFLLLLFTNMYVYYYMKSQNVLHGYEEVASFAMEAILITGFSTLFLFAVWLCKNMFGDFCCD